MNHRDERFWRMYAQGMLGETERLEAEEHLAACGGCLERYMELLMGVEEIEPLGGDAADAVTARVMAAIAELEPFEMAAGPNEDGQMSPPTDNAAARRKPVKRSSRKQTMIHYLIAVSVMLVLMSTGVFQRIAEQPQHWEEHQVSKRESVTTSIMERTAAVIDAIVEKPNK
ncbi:hypothetical protein [Paenibacillus montanisoli]|uniref:Zinc-finger domain-containing protein n=1 Tax=Paenibacillus montanisoli TaxID=2081970 RepID=A0A328TZB5_9BACL|nr:hypothetical protein [Paenibacillus montanisoli]RAP73945.1 hypothetical protein DL346_22980 [Paenibacillus montanisoli]